MEDSGPCGPACLGDTGGGPGQCCRAAQPDYLGAGRAGGFKGICACYRRADKAGKGKALGVGPPPLDALVAIPMQFWCEFIRSYDVTTFYYTTPKPIDQQYYPTPNDTKKVKYSGPELVRGVDYEVVDENGNVISPDSDGAFSFLWKNAQKGVQNVYIKALPGAKSGSFNLQTFNPASSVKLSNQDVESTVQSRTDKYEVRIFTQNYYVTVTIK